MPDHLSDFQKLIDVLESLLAPGGCEWDRKQTHKSLVPYLLEETHEVIEAIENGDMDSLKEELGDLMLHILFQAKLAESEGHFSVSDSLKDISSKLISWMFTLLNSPPFFKNKSKSFKRIFFGFLACLAYG